MDERKNGEEERKREECERKDGEGEEGVGAKGENRERGMWKEILSGRRRSGRMRKEGEG